MRRTSVVSASLLSTTSSDRPRRGPRQRRAVKRSLRKERRHWPADPSVAPFAVASESTSVRRTAAVLATAERLLALLPPETGFEPYSFVAFAYGEENERENLRRSFRFELDGCWTHLTVEAPRRSSWRKRVLDGLTSAGYEPWLSGDQSADVRRWLRTASDRRGELRFLEDLGSTGAIVRWPRRTPTSRPAPTPQGRWSRSRWQLVIDEAYQSGVPWDDGGLCFSRTSERAASAKSGLLTVNTGIIPWWDSRENGKALLVFASVSDGSNLLPSRIAQRFRRVLRDAGFEPDGARSTRDGTVLRGRVGFDQRFSTENGAVRACLRIHDALLELPMCCMADLRLGSTASTASCPIRSAGAPFENGTGGRARLDPV